MLRKIVHIILVIFFATTGASLGYYLTRQHFIPLPQHSVELSLGIAVLGALLGLLVGFLLAPWLMRGAGALTAIIEQYLQKTPTQDLIMGSVGLILGLIIANLLGSILSYLGFIGRVIWILTTIMLGYTGMVLFVKKREDIIGFFVNLARLNKDKPVREAKASNIKILDTSVIIDGRIADLCASGFIEGVLLVPAFVLEELRHIADSADVLKRNRGRRGLDVLNTIRKGSQVKVQIYENVRWLDENAEVDTKLVQLAKKLSAKIMTNDYNLNKVAELQGVTVLNINELANAVKPVVLPGEEMTVQLVKEGKEPGQGVGYLDDGTMIVVENGKKYVGQTISVLVTSVLQTAAGRMIFARPRQQREGNGASSEVKLLG
ncbi:PIN/TRAM domain-containing protein [Desulfurispora thermophila]|uniref:PIN/TRAM domain-containing protein n=1 Tax=Desulfurispora thermophila TaxID=265470 RepID=UPI00036EF178|nr:PIN/TRAM domain-containing protein [Desulfurispora thermophila]